MKHHLNHFLIVICVLLCESFFAQQVKLSDFYIMQRIYENRPENDSTALPLVGKVLQKAKSQKDQLQLFRGYNDCRFFSPDPIEKLKYADSAIWVAERMNDDNLLSSAYLSKGIIYYFNLKKYKLALDEYLKAFEKNNSDSDPYYRNKIRYHIGVVRSYIGFYEDAIEEFKKNRNFFEGELKKDMHPNLMFGNQRGYYNTLHQMAVCYRNLHQYRLADSLVSVGLTNTWKNEDFKQEYAYFLKEEGISKYRKKDYHGAVKTFEMSLPDLTNINDFAWISIVYYYMGKAKWESGHVDEAVKDFEKIDSIFVKHTFILPEVRPVYQDLLSYYYKKNNSVKLSYYVDQSRKVEKILEQDFLYLSKKIYRGYDSFKLIKETKELERENSISMWITIIVVFICMFFVFYTMLRIKSQNAMEGKNRFLGINLGGNQSDPILEGTYRILNYTRNDISFELENDILSRLEEFEKNKEFLMNDVHLNGLAEKFGVSRSSLSDVINTHKGVNFHLYIGELRIAYITEKLNTDPKYLKYSSTALAKDCGMNTRQTFSRLFRDINGINLEKFLEERAREVKRTEI